jgi:hypothetical protein
MSDDLDTIVKMREILARGAILDMGIHPVACYLDSGGLSLGGIYKAVVGTTFNRHQMLLCSFRPTNSGEGEPEATARIAPTGDKD